LTFTAFETVEEGRKSNDAINESGRCRTVEATQSKEFETVEE
jgi:hypothetical protein